VTIRIALEHTTVYRFDRPVTVHPHVVRLRPAPHSRTPIASYSLSVSPPDHFLNWQQDAFGNYLARLVFPEPTTELSFTVDLTADMSVVNPFDFFLEPYAERAPFSYPQALRNDLEPYLRSIDEDPARPGSGPGQLVRDWVAALDAPPPDSADALRTVDFLVDLNQRISKSVAYSVRMEPGVQTPDHTLGVGIGSCRDSAWLLVSVLRELGLAARFVSGYLIQLVPDQPSPVDGAAPFTQDFTDLHAWAEVYVPGAGWIGMDATSGLFAGEGHIPLAATPHPSSAAPIEGATSFADVEFGFSNVVTRVREDPRVTKPYTVQQWERIDALGHAVDQRLAAGDVRLTMGGEPTFVSATDMDSAQWSTAADGADKRARATALATRCVERWAPQGLVHHGQGKWYPGEPLPRWQIGITWRQDGEPIWRNRALLDDPWGPPVLEPSSHASRTSSQAFADRLAGLLGVPVEYCLPAYEDALHALWDAARLPQGAPPQDDVDAAGHDLSTPAGRAALTQRLDAELGQVQGWVIPLARTQDGEHWRTERWTFRRGRMVLLPGTSPLGLRLPLDGLAWSAPAAVMDPSALAVREQLPAAPVAPSGPSGARAAVIGDVEDSPRTALCVQERDGHLFVFLPPLTELEPALDLIAMIESAAAHVGVPVVLEGYPLPGDPRTATLTVTPDPGVIEVNVQPAGSWPELSAISLKLDQDARDCGLATEKFDVDGIHTGTGGGSHLTLGGPKAADSPLLRRPDLLRSMVTYWQHHPALSYLFSGRFIGPTSQAPRVDEGRHETLYELEIAFGQLDQQAEAGTPAPPWFVDRALRNLLTDLTGNTHRSEFCIDKLFSPDSERGRLGLLELRGFEMPPHPQMSLVQALLVRCLVTRFWEDPYRGTLVRWGTQLHDRFLTPAGAAADIADVVADLNEHGLPFELSWLDPFLEFRFPLLGTTSAGGVELELRQAVEPWNVLGEEATAGGTARYVDSSVERVEVRARGVVPGRHVITCNGVPVPLTPTGSANEAAAGVRFTAWAPPSKLHPAIGVQSPLVFDVLDRWNGRSLGGFTFHVTHPGGRSYDTYPVNASEAEARRGSRFVTSGHTPGPIDVSTIPDGGIWGQGEYPRTLDLRQHWRIPG
jgi:uncharacterized protein (DUF2126 family)/transglutaminase-like putative cysteine protease